MPDFFDRLGDELRRAAQAPLPQASAASSGFIERLGAELARAAAAPAPEPAPALRRSRRPAHARRRSGLRRPRLVLVAALAAVLAIAGAAVGLSVNWTPSAVPPEAGRGMVLETEASLAQAFSILKAPVSAIPFKRHAEFSGASGANALLARKVASGREVEAWVVPGRGYVCSRAQWAGSGAGGGSCLKLVPGGPRYSIALTSTDSAPGREFVIGLVADGIESISVEGADGTLTTLQAHENLVLAEVAAPVRAVLLTEDGKPVKVAYGAP